MPLTALGTASYNGYTFSSYAETVGMSASYRYDGAGRTIIYSEWTISIRDRVFFTGSTSLDDQMDAIQTQLGVPAGEFVYTSHGFGNFSINVNGTRDVKWGPRPIGFTTKSSGRDQAREFTWTVVVCVPQSCVSPTYAGAIMAFNYTADYSIDRIGYTSRNITGYIEIPITRSSVSSRQIPDDADRYLENFIPSLPVGFQRTSRSHRVSADRSRIDFAYTDEQMVPQIYQQGVAVSDLTHSVRNEKPMLFYSWIANLSGSYTMAANVPRQMAVQRFFELIENRLQAGFNNAFVAAQAGTNANSNKPVKETKGFVLPISFSMTEPINDKTSGSFTFTYKMMCDLDRLLQATGQWTQLPNTNYNQWLSSVGSLSAGSMMGPRGTAQLKHLPSDDVIVDLCVQPQVSLSTLSTALQSRVLRTSPFSVNAPPPESSFLDASIKLEVVSDTNASVMKAIPNGRSSLSASLGASTKTDNLSTLPIGGGGRLINQSVVTGMPPNQMVDVVQQRTEPSIKFWLYGFIERAYYPVTPPRLTSVGGQPAVLLKNYFAQETIGNVGMPVFHADFAQLYAIPSGNFAAMPVPPNPANFTPLYNNQNGWSVLQGLDV